MTASTQLKSANTTASIAFHDGLTNRGKLRHKNENIDTSKSHHNAEIDIFNKDELLEIHYRDKIDKHNKNNNSAARRWDSMEDFLATFEGKKVKSRGIITTNERWATMSQISYLGGKDSLNPVIEELIEYHGIPEEEFREAYTAGYEAYIHAHNEAFPTMPIYHSDIHFDETVPHGHDAIVMMGHTEKGAPSDSLTNALGEKYGYKKSFEGSKENLELFRAENDALIFENVGGAIERLAESYGIDLDFDFIRTGEEGGKDMPTYQQNKDFKRRESELASDKAVLDKSTDAEVRLRNSNRKRGAELATKEKKLEKLDSERLEFDNYVVDQTAQLREKAEKEVEELLKAEREAFAERERKVAQMEYMQEFKNYILNSDDKPVVMSQKELDIALKGLTNDVYGVSKTKAGNLVYTTKNDRGGLKKAKLEDVVQNVYEMSPEKSVIYEIDDSHQATSHLARVAGYVAINGHEAYDSVVLNDGFDYVGKAVGGVVAEYERQRELENQFE